MSGQEGQHHRPATGSRPGEINGAGDQVGVGIGWQGQGRPEPSPWYVVEEPGKGIVTRVAQLEPAAVVIVRSLRWPDLSCRVCPGRRSRSCTRLPIGSGETEHVSCLFGANNGTVLSVEDR